MTPIAEHKDETGSYFQYGTTGKKYYFDPESKLSKDRAQAKARKQELAILESRIEHGMSPEKARKETFGA